MVGGDPTGEGEKGKQEEGYLSVEELWELLGMKENRVVNENLDRVKAVKELLERNRDVFVSPGRQIGHAPSEFEFAINLRNEAKPVRQANRPLHPLIKAELRNHLDTLLEEGVISASNSPWASPIVPVKKKDGSYRFCVDFRKVNANTIADNYPLPNIEEILMRMGGAKFFSSIDASSAYHAIKVRESDRPKTVFVCAFGLFEYNRMPFGLMNAGPMYSRMAAAMERSMHTAQG